MARTEGLQGRRQRQGIASRALPALREDDAYQAGGLDTMNKKKKAALEERVQKGELMPRTYHDVKCDCFRCEVVRARIGNIQNHNDIGILNERLKRAEQFNVALIQGVFKAAEPYRQPAKAEAADKGAGEHEETDKGRAEAGTGGGTGEEREHEGLRPGGSEDDGREDRRQREGAAGRHTHLSDVREGGTPVSMQVRQARHEGVHRETRRGATQEGNEGGAGEP